MPVSAEALPRGEHVVMRCHMLLPYWSAARSHRQPVEVVHVLHLVEPYLADAHTLQAIEPCVRRRCGEKAWRGPRPQTLRQVVRQESLIAVLSELDSPHIVGHDRRAVSGLENGLDVHVTDAIG